MLARQDALNIADKLHAEIKPGGDHDLAVFRWEGKRILQFGIHRGSGGHDYLQRQLHISLRQCQDLSNCPLKLEEYVEILRGKNLL
jgi:hypothetical protein